MTGEDPFAPPDDGRMAASSPHRPDPDRVEATFVGVGKADETWKMSLTPERLFFELEGSETSVSMSKPDVAETLNVGTLSSQRVGILLRKPEARVFQFPREALDYVYGWLGVDLQADFRARVLRRGWGSTLAVGLLFLLPMDLPQLAGLFAQVAGATLVAAALVSRFTTHRAGLLLRALGWALLAAQMAYGVVVEARSPWMLLVSALLLWGVVRYARLFGFFGGGRDGGAPQGT